MDHRSDLFSFGVLFYGMLSGKRAFVGSSSEEVMDLILGEDPPALPAMVPGTLAAIVNRCLKKPQDVRLRSAGDLADGLPSAFEGVHAGPVSPVRPVRARDQRSLMLRVIRAKDALRNTCPCETKRSAIPRLVEYLDLRLLYRRVAILELGQGIVPSITKGPRSPLGAGTSEALELRPGIPLSV